LPPTTLKDFRTLYDALFGGSAVLLQGLLDASVQSGSPAESIQFVASMSDLVGDVLDQTYATDTQGISVTLRNAIESPVTIPRIDALLQDASGINPGLITGASPPIRLAPNQTLSFSVAGQKPVSGGTTVGVAFPGLEVTPDPTAIWSAILDSQQLSEYSAQIKVQAFKATFDPPVNSPDQQIVAIKAEFERGTAVELLPANLDATGVILVPTTVRMSIGDYVLNHEDNGQYRFKTTVVRKDGTQTSDADWQSSTDQILILPTVGG
jgi:hypothetical protein